ncbi:MAG: TonB-dependent receptor plug domain-containing protein [Phenylobacterium sp.]|uniref:TonB-dependent receptor plug domain-containing protein n=1 Tax=Phenylobacterium sp. TaxID=1871053 RepID=UPI00391BB519
MKTRMVSAFAAAWTAVCCLPGVALSQAAQADSSGLIAYPPEFFAEMAPSSAHDMVLRLPGFSFDKGAAVRGLAGSGGNVLIDGEPPVSKNDTLEEILKRIPFAAVARIEVIRGGAPGIDMQGRTVIANVVRKQAAGARGAVGYSIHPLRDGRVLNALRTEGQWRWDGRLLELSTVYGKGPDDSMGDGPRRRYGPTGAEILASDVDADAQGERRWLLGAFETPLARGRLRVNGAYMDTRSSVELIDRLIRPAGGEYEYITSDRLQAEAGARFSRRFSIGALEAVAFQQWNNLETIARFESASVNRLFVSDKQVAETVGRLNLRRRQSETLSLELGVEGAFNTLDSKTALTMNGAAIAVPAANVRVEEARAEVFGLATWRPAAALTLEGGLRQETSTISSSGDVVLEKSLSFTKPRLAATWALAADQQLRARIEREVSQLNFDDFVASSSVASTGVVLAGNPDLSPQQAWIFETAYEHRFWGDGAAILTLRHAELTDVIDRAPIGAAGVLADGPANIGEGTKDELVLSLALPLERLKVKGATVKALVTMRDSEVVDPTTGQTREISGLRPLEWEVRYAQDLPRWKATVGLDLFGGFRESYYRLTEVETRKYDPWVTAFLEMKPRPEWVLRVELQNLTQRGFTRIREVHAGSRASAPIAYVDVRDLDYGQALFLRLRRIFG